MPDYISSCAHLDFRSLLRLDAGAEDITWAGSISLDNELRGQLDGSELLQRMIRISKLDPGQVKALLETLQRSIAITHGPPGALYFLMIYCIMWL